jgi:beta-glucosidase
VSRFIAALLAASILVTPGVQAQSSVEATRALVNPEIWPAPGWPHAQNPAHEQRIAELLKRMTVEEKVGQVIQADIASVTPAEVKRFHLGSVLNGGNSAPGGDEFAPPAKWLALADAFHAASVDTSGGRAAVPVFWGTDAVHGHSNIVGATLFPHNIGLGATRDPDLIERIGAVTAIEIRTTGQDWTFAPTITVPQDFRWGRAYEGYSSDPALVASYVGRMITGLQGNPGAGPVLRGPHVIASTKHFLADGGTSEGHDQGDARISEAELRDIHGLPYVPAIEAGVETVMTSFSSWNGVKIAGHKGLLTDVLKGRMNFGGLIVTDWNAHGQVAGCTNASCPEALLAGIDMYMAPDTWRDLYATLLAQVKAGKVPIARLDDAVARILRVKMRMGLFEAGPPSSRTLAGRFDLLGSAAHREVAREAVRKSLVLLKNQGGVLPLRSGATVLVAGDAADDIGRQSGGWTLTWQGTGTNNSHFPGATSIWGGIAAAVKAGGGQATLSTDGRFTARPDVAVVVFGETPYAEFQGDLKTLQLRPELRKPFETLRKLKAEGIPVVAVMVTGRPLFVNEALNLADAFVVAWLPGSEGGGVADVLTSAGGADFTGKLPTHWPETAIADGRQLYPFGYGLRMASAAPAWTPLPEDPGVAETSAAGLLLDRGVPMPPLSLHVSDGKGDHTRLTTMPATANQGRVRISATDHLVQEGARRFDVTSGPASIEIVAIAPLDWARETNGDVQLVITLRRDGPVTGPAALGVRRGSAIASIPFDRLAALPQGSWRRVGVPLKCFAAAGATMGAVEVPFHLSLPGGASVSLAQVALGTDADESLSCR